MTSLTVVVARTERLSACAPRYIKKNRNGKIERKENVNNNIYIYICPRFLMISLTVVGLKGYQLVLLNKFNKK